MENLLTVSYLVEKKPTTPNETTSPPTTPSLSTSNEGVIAGITVPIATVLFVITVAIIMTVIICKRKNGQLC